VEADWFAASDIYKYKIDVNVDFEIGSWKQARFALGGGILTYIEGSDTNAFQPSRYRGTVEPQVYLERGCDIYSFSVRHQSYHSIDSLPSGAESYELYNLGYLHRGRPNICFQIGRYGNQNGVDYEWNGFLDVDTGYIGRCRYGPFYVKGTLQYVRESGEIPDRHQFFNYILEMGVQNTSGVRYFTAYRQIHDVNQFNGITDHEWAFGVRYVW
jgi:hypothetical protein